jgi:hypothetical protein
MVFIKKRKITMKNRIREIDYKICSFRKSRIHAHKLNKLRKNILTYYRHHPTTNEEINFAVDYLSSHSLTSFFGTFQEQYRAEEVRVYRDPSNGLPYVMVNDKRLYFKRSYNKHTVQLVFNGLRIEQDPNSPHCYTDKNFDVEKDDILADIGCAEGFFSLLNIEEVKKVYLFEQDRCWVEALQATFAPCKEKTILIPQFVSDKTTDTEIRPDDYFHGKKDKPTFYKIDVEGAETRVLNGMKSILKQPPLKIALCTYHHAEDFESFCRLLKENDFTYRPSSGLMIYQNEIDNMQPPYFRKGLIKAWKKK